MKVFKTLALACLLAGAATNGSASNLIPPVKLQESTPARTIVIKNMEAEDLDKFFSNVTMLNFEVYKVGSKADIANLIAEVQKQAGVESLNLGVTTGDYQAFTLVLKKAQTKQWFVALFKQAGLDHIKVNRRPVVQVEKL